MNETRKRVLAGLSAWCYPEPQTGWQQGLGGVGNQLPERTAIMAPTKHLHPLGLYADQSADDPEDFVIPEDFTSLDDEALTALHTQAVETFNTLYGDGEGLSDADMESLTALTEGIETLQTEVSRRAEASAERATAAAALAARVNPEAEAETSDEEDEDEDDEEDEEDAEDEAEEGAEAEVTDPALVASGPVRVPLSRVRSRSKRTPRQRPADQPSMADIVASTATGITGYAVGQGLNWSDIGTIVDKRLGKFNVAQYTAARKAKTHLREQLGVFSLSRPTQFRLDSNDPQVVDDMLRQAGDESRLAQGNLVAAGGWCAPSETIYDLCELEGRDGLFDLPNIAVTRGGINRTLGPDFSAIYNGTGWHYTEAEVIAGDFDGEGGGTKPCYNVPCPDFEPFRLDVAGLCLTAGLLQQKGYPEVIARTVRGALVAHDHKLAGRRLADIEAGSTAVTMGAMAGAAAPVLASIEMQVTHMRNANRIPRTRSLEAVFPHWTLALIRADLAYRDGINVFDVSDAQIINWFRLRGVNPQFVYNWQDLSGAAADFTSWPDTVKFHLYPSGTWVGAGSEVLTLDTIYDSVLLGTNDFTALWTEESYMVVKMCHDSRTVAVPVCPNGAIGSRYDLDCNGAVVVETP